jgi:hypothetical protein
MKEPIQISLTEFMNFVNKSGSAKATVVKQAKNRRDDEYKHFTDYWLPFRDKLNLIHKRNFGKDRLDSLLSEINPDKRDNYRMAIEGYKKFMGRKNIEWLKPIKKTWTIGEIRIVLNPDLCLEINDTIYIIKLFLSSNETIDKKHADLILTLMEKELRSKVGSDEPIFAVLDVKKGKLYEKNNKDIPLYNLLVGEAKSFEIQWNAIM